MVQETFQGLEQIKAWFIGPLAENREFCKKSFADIIESYLQWRTNYGDDRGIITEDDIERNEPSHRQLKQLLNELLQELKSNFPFYSPRYIGHMLSEQTIPAMLGYFAAMLYNPNNVTPQAAPVTAKLEIEVGNLVSGMLGFDTKKSWTHICSGGTIANLEAFWAARAVQFLPLCLKHACDALKINLIVNNPNGRNTNLLKTPDKVLLCLRPDTALSLAVAFESAVSKRNDIDKQYLQKVIEDCEFNPRSQGLYTVCKKLKMNPVIFVSSAAHYSIAKAAHVLGYGEMAVKSIPVDSKFRIDLTELQDHLSKLKPTEWVAGVVGIVGTTEEGAVDSIDQIVGIREEYEKEQNRSFWIHIDAAWGGYFASVFRKDSRDHSWSDRAVRTVVSNPAFSEIKQRQRTVSWPDANVFKAYKAIREADSVTVDPHKTGYIPYPAGMIIFRNAGLKDLLLQRAQYISGDSQAREDIGPFILEGSKPGASAAACWLAHKVITLDSNGHGLILKECLTNAQKLMFYLTSHKLIFDVIEREFKHSPSQYPFEFIPICNPDTNVVTFIARPLNRVSTDESDESTDKPAKATFLPAAKSLSWINEFNARIHQKLSIDSTKDHETPIQSKAFFISNTEFKHLQYSADSLHLPLLKRLGISKLAYKEKGLFLLRATVMNPFYRFAEKRGKDLLFEFIKHLHSVAREAATQLWESGYS